jgi:hypothetical protein
MPQATYPLSPSATAAADNAFYKSHPEMVKDGKRVPLDPCDPQQAAMRREWMNNYAANGGAVEPASGGRCAERIKTAEADAAGPSSPTAAVAPCAQTSPPNLKTIATAPKPEKPPVPCALVSNTVKCQHGRKPQNAILYVVQDSIGGDTISCTATTKGTCGDHVAWTISGATDKQTRGNTTDFPAKAFAADLLLFNLEKAEPQIYRVQSTACEGGAPVNEIRAYPSEKRKFSLRHGESEANEGKIGLEKIVNTVLGWMEYLPMDPAKKLELEAKWFKGSATLSQEWKEEKSSHLAYCETKIAIGLAPLIELSTGDWQIYPPGLVPAALAKYIKAGLYGSGKGAADLTVDVSYKYSPETCKRQYEKTVVSLKGGLSVSLSIQLFIVDEKVVKASVKGETGFECSGEWGLSETVEIQAKWTGLTAALEIEAAWGWIDVERSYPIKGEQELYKTEIDIFG